MNALLMFFLRIVVAVESVFRQGRKDELDFPAVVQGIESLVGDTFRIREDGPRATPVLSFIDYAGECVSVLLKPNNTFSIARGDVWEIELSPALALQTIWTDLRGR